MNDKRQCVMIEFYEITEQKVIDCLQTRDLDGFKALLEEDDCLLFGEPERIYSEGVFVAFYCRYCYLKNEVDERGFVVKYPLMSCEPSDIPFIRAIKNY